MTVKQQGNKCVKCGHDEHAIQLRRVEAKIGWDVSRVLVVAPAHMCTKCGNLVVFIETNIGDLVDLVPEAPPASLQELDNRIAAMERHRPRLAEHVAASAELHKRIAAEKAKAEKRNAARLQGAKAEKRNAARLQGAKVKPRKTKAAKKATKAKHTKKR